MYLGIDFGKKRIGLALGQMIPRGIGMIDGNKPIDQIVFDIKKICSENEVTGIVIGSPKKRSGDPGELTDDIERFVLELNKSINLPVHFEEEEFTSVEAEEILKESGKSYTRKSGKTDEMAAVLILEQFINHLNDPAKEK
jgi:putative Holliday junction resolvase